MTGSLALFEARRLLRSPVLWGAAVLALAAAVAGSSSWLPDMTMVTIGSVTASTIVGAAVLISANLAAGRDRRHGLPETLGALPGRAVTRTRAVVLAAPAVGALVAVVMLAAHLGYVWATGPVAGRIDVYEALGGVALATLAAGIGAALARWTPWLVMPPLLICLLAFAVAVNPRGEYAGGFLPLVLNHSPEWGPRPSGQHLAYLVAVGVVLAAAALLRHGLRPVRTVVLPAALAVAVTTGMAATASARSGAKLPAQVCRTYEGVSYCVYPDYAAWIPVWGKALHPLLSAVPERVRARIPAIRQRVFGHGAIADMDEPTTWTVWSTDPALHQALLVGQVAGVVTGLAGCGAGRAQTMVALWLVGRAGPLLDAPPPQAWRPSGAALPEGMREVPMGANGSLVMPGQLHGARYGAAEVGYARRLLERPDAAERVRAHWDTLTAPGTTIKQALPLLGLREEFQVKEEPCP
ncbi:hypothetical protein [Nonomuraea sp. NPDC049695]|uniref:hypothetical protein n=1 Tax=Nonomuraea sp. NPDC049695 TaxID=3154734 RepID=UPI00343FFF62